MVAASSTVDDGFILGWHMQALSIVIFQSDPRQAQALAGTLSLHYHSVHVAESGDSLRTAIARYRAEVAVIDVEVSCLSEVTRLHREFPGLSIVCTHRVADEEMWAAALNAGAADMCPAFDTQGIVQSAERNAPLAHAHA
jgi:DNA-binding NtrC family response regulator